jgi:uncharacterized zinc-type alcohol dehydrogenase-like protein
MGSAGCNVYWFHFSNPNQRKDIQLKRFTSFFAVILAFLIPSVPAIAHPVGEHCCIYHETYGGIYKNSPRRAGGDITAATPGAIECVGLAAMKPGAPVEPYKYYLAPLGDYDVLVDVLYCGICHSDIHALDGEFGRPGDLGHFPYVAGHEAVGRVAAVGSKVTQRKVGDIVGMGCYKGFCGHCDACGAHEEQYCPDYMLSYDLGGGMATKLVVPEDYAFAIPANVPLEKAGPLLCAGVTTYSAVKQCNVKPGMKCAVIGFGGLGHMAAKIMKYMGAEVTVFDINTTKAEAAKKMGFAFVDANDEKTKWSMGYRFDVIISTAPAAYDLTPYVNMLKVHGRLHSLGLPNKPQTVMLPLVTIANRTITGSAVGSVEDHREALAFCAAHDILPEVEVIRADEANGAMTKLRNATGEFRYVIDMKTLAAPASK